MQMIDWRDGRPIYEQITERIKHLILMDALASGEQLPSVRSLAMENGTNPNTVQKAYTELERQGFTYTVPGRGVFVADSKALKEKKKEEIIGDLTRLLTEAAEVGLDGEALCKEALRMTAQTEKNGGGQ